MTEYVKECVYCTQKIRMSDESGKWQPYNQDGSVHDCKTKEGKQQEDKKQTAITVEMVLKKLQSIGIDIDLDRLMKQ